jgi:hypothetical protein
MSSESERCWTSTREELRCRTEREKDTDELRNVCVRTRETLRHCTGKPDEVIESSHETTNMPLKTPEEAGPWLDVPLPTRLHRHEPLDDQFFSRALFGDRGFFGTESLKEALSFTRSLENALREAREATERSFQTEDKEAQRPRSDVSLRRGSREA